MDNDGVDARATVTRDLSAGGELVDIEREDVGTANGEPYDPERIDVVTRTPTVALMLSRLRRGTIDLQPDFQRLAGIWSEENQSRLIESILLRIPLPAFYAAEVPDDDDGVDRWAIVDGIQRLTAIVRFMAPSSEFSPLTLRGLNYLDFNGKRFDDLPGRLQTRLEETEIVLHLIRKGTPDEAKFNIFARLNTGGLPLTTQELRHALIPGRARTLLGELADSAEFRAATSGSVAKGRMADREMVLRFLAFSISDPLEYREKDFDKFLRDSMHRINHLGELRVAQLRTAFTMAMNTNLAVFGKYAFRKQYESNAARYPVNKALFEVLAVGFAARPRAARRIENSPRSFVKGFRKLLSDNPRFDRAISVSTGDPASIRYRFAMIDALLADYDRG
ncbi:DUF262 domain-containing protein [Nocardia caishijiensis]|uniref:Uncharacterized protein DUF262 n=1 Tax=Nocardia caishijiensis TaxID=184756 RepID=A0ABQ6YGK9_9NOCA|nr:DUF262 domain-containing protein [Nocardia caishijiensis]KAF0842485.1 uncharacterized protein DUF262 [Nocardia caishijiensis]